MSAFKKLSKSDQIVIPYNANKDWLFHYDNPNTDNNIKFYRGTNITGSFNTYSPRNFDNSYEKLVYDEINHLFYQKFSSSLNTHSLVSSLNYLSASQYRPTESYFVYDENPAFIPYFPTGSGEHIWVISVNPLIYGNKIKPGSFIFSEDPGLVGLLIVDDGNGNLFAAEGDSSFYVVNFQVGNIFYNHGLAIVGHQGYIDELFEETPIAYDDTVSRYNNVASQSISILSNDFSGSNPMNTSSIELYNDTFGVYRTGSNGILVCNTDDIGTYTVFYTFKSVSGSKSNKGKVTTNIYSYPFYPIAYNDNNNSFITSISPKNILPLSNDYSGEVNFNTSSIELYNNGSGVFITGSGGRIICNTSVTGTYSVEYTFKNLLGYISNRASVSASVVEAPVTGSSTGSFGNLLLLNRNVQSENIEFISYTQFVNPTYTILSGSFPVTNNSQMNITSSVYGAENIKLQVQFYNPTSSKHIRVIDGLGVEQKQNISASANFGSYYVDTLFFSIELNNTQSVISIISGSA